MITKLTILKIRIWTGSIALSLLCSMFPGIEAFSAEWTHTYDVMDRLQSRTDPLGRTESYIYDLAGNLLRSTDRKGQVTTFTYDALNRISRVDYADGSFTTFGYDAVSRLTRVTDSTSGPIDFFYNNLDRLILEVTPQGAVAYEYDVIGRRTKMTVAGQVPVTYAYDAASRLTQITQGNQTVVIGYDAAGRRIALVYPNGTVTTYAYDNASRLTAIVHALGTSQVENLSYSYDAAGNRVTATRGNGPAVSLPPPTQAAYDASNQQTKFNSGTPNLTYDANGNLSSKTDTSGTATYTWDARNRLIAVTSPGTSAAFTYDALNRRISKSINGETTQYLYDRHDVVQEIRDSAVSATYLRSLNVDEPFARYGTGTTASAEYYHADGLGSVLVLTSAAGAVQTTYTYDPFGNTSVTGGSSANPFQFTGRENDGTGLYYYRARYYIPALHRFLTEDPLNLSRLRRLFDKYPEAQFFYHLYLSDPQRQNAYAYVGNAPMTYVDPFGLLFWNYINAGEEFGEEAAQYWADLAYETGNPLYNIPGIFASLWTRKTSDATLATLGGGYFARLTTPGGDVGTPKFLQKVTRPYIRLDPPGHAGKGWELDGKIPNWFRRVLTK